MRHPIVYTLLSSLLLLWGCHTPQQQRGEYEVLGTVEGLEDGDTLYLSDDLITRKQIDTLIVKDHKFSLKGTTDSSKLFIVYSADDRKMSVPFFIEPGTITVNLSNIHPCEVSGTEMNEELQEVNDTLVHYTNRLNALSTQMHSAGSTSKDTYQQGAKQMEELFNRAYHFLCTTAERNIDNDLGYLIIFKYGNGLPLIDNTEMLKLMERLPADKREKMQHEIEMLYEEQTAMESVLSEGEELNDMVLPDRDGNNVSVLSEVKKHRVTIIDFWASWCAPCMRLAPELVEIWQEYKDKGLGILGISLDTDRKSWLNAIESKGMSWQHVSDLAGWDSKAASEYGVSAIPATALVDSKGKILLVNGSIDQISELIAEELKK